MEDLTTSVSSQCQVISVSFLFKFFKQTCASQLSQTPVTVDPQLCGSLLGSTANAMEIAQVKSTQYLELNVFLQNHSSLVTGRKQRNAVTAF